MEAVAEIVSDQASPPDLRTAALEVLGSYVHPAIYSVVEDPHWQLPEYRYHIRSRTHLTQRVGAVPLQESDKLAILRTIGQIAGRGAADEPLSGMAAAVLHFLEVVRDGPKGTPHRR